MVRPLLSQAASTGLLTPWLPCLHLAPPDGSALALWRPWSDTSWMPGQQGLT